MMNDADKARGLSLFLEENGIIVPFMNYPSGQELYMIRIAVSAIHTDDQAEELIEALKKWRKKN
jgi:7-keto-8-aminopelargonate synthetase-like enzyme